MLHAASHERAALLAQLDALYDWLKPEAKGAHHPRNTATAQRKLHDEWPELLPHEREEAVDWLLSVYCRSRRVARFDWAEISYNSVAEEIGYGSRDSASHRLPEKDDEDVKVCVHAIAEAASKANPERARSWFSSFLSPGGMSIDKLGRMHKGMIEIVLRELNAVLALVQIHVPRPGTTLSNHLLPSADQVFLTAHIDTQPAHDRLEIIRVLFDSLHKLYEAPLGRALPPSDDYLETIHTGQETLDRPLTEQQFDGLSVRQQCDAVAHVRNLLFSACKERATAAKLPDPKTLTNELFRILLNPALVGRAPDATTANSLAHAHKYCRIAPRTARQYYGTTAQEWEAQRAAMGW